MSEAVANLLKTPPAVEVKPSRGVPESPGADSDDVGFDVVLEKSQTSAQEETVPAAQETPVDAADDAPDEDGGVGVKPEDVPAVEDGGGEAVEGGGGLVAPVAVTVTEQQAAVQPQADEDAPAERPIAARPGVAGERGGRSPAVQTAARSEIALNSDLVQTAEAKPAEESKPVEPTPPRVGEAVETAASKAPAAVPVPVQAPEESAKPGSATSEGPQTAQPVAEIDSAAHQGTDGGRREQSGQHESRANTQAASVVNAPEAEVHFEPLAASEVKSTSVQASAVIDEATTARSAVPEPVAAVQNVKAEPAAPAPVRAQVPTTLPTPEPPSSLQQAAERTMLTSAQRGLSAALAQRGGEMTIRLAPEALGSLRIALSVAEGTVSATLTASNAGAARMLSGNLDGLRESIEARGLQVDRLTVTSAPTSASNVEQGGSRQEQQLGREADRHQGDGRSRGRSDDQSNQNNHENKRESRFTQQWKLALDATA